MKPNTPYNKMTAKALMNLIQQLQGHLQAARARELAVLRKSIEALATESGLAMADIVGKPAKRKYTKRAKPGPKPGT